MLLPFSGIINSRLCLIDKKQHKSDQVDTRKQYLKNIQTIVNVVTFFTTTSVIEECILVKSKHYIDAGGPFARKLKFN